MIDRVYVATVGNLGHYDGQFVDNSAFISVDDAIKAAERFMAMGPPPTAFVEVTSDPLRDGTNVLKRWDSDDTTVWVESLIIEGEQ